jgi:ABC-type branched-subunit amino acid transport system permease subunit
VVTLALAFAMEAVWFRNSDIIPSEVARVTTPSLLGADLGIGSGAAFPRLEFGLVCLVTLVMVSLDVAVLRRSSLGSAMLAVRANERSAAAAGVNVVQMKVLSFALASFIAGLRKRDAGAASGQPQPDRPPETAGSAEDDDPRAVGHPLTLAIMSPSATPTLRSKRPWS